MLYDLTNDKEARQASNDLNKHIATDHVIEIKRVFPKRTTSQNAYFHVLLGLFGGHFGWSVDEVKDFIKLKFGYVREMFGETIPRSSADFTTQEMTDVIDRFRKFSADQGLYLPDPDGYIDNWAFFQNEVAAYERYAS